MLCCLVCQALFLLLLGVWRRTITINMAPLTILTMRSNARSSLQWISQHRQRWLEFCSLSCKLPHCQLLHRLILVISGHVALGIGFAVTTWAGEFRQRGNGVRCVCVVLHLLVCAVGNWLKTTWWVRMIGCSITSCAPWFQISCSFNKDLEAQK